MAWPAVARAQQGEPIHRIGALFPAPKDDPDYQPWIGRIPEGTARAGLDRGPQYANRYPLGYGQSCRDSQTGGGIGGA